MYAYTKQKTFTKHNNSKQCDINKLQIPSKSKSHGVYTSEQMLHHQIKIVADMLFSGLNPEIA